METSMTIRSLATLAPTIAIWLANTAMPAVSSGALQGAAAAPFAVAAVQDAAPNFAGISNWFNSPRSTWRICGAR
jgi:hypothetical protein